MGSDYTPGRRSDYCMHANAQANERPKPANTKMVRSHPIHDFTGNLCCFSHATQMERLILLIALVVILPVLLVLDTSPADSNIPDKEVTASQTEASNSTASATITITMYTVADE